MSNAKQRGRADAAKGTYNPPKPDIFPTKSQVERCDREKEEYREGYYDKKREMEKEKKK